MSAFADTSFLFAFYFPRTGSDQAIAKMESLRSPALISTLVRFEFQQAVWFKVWLHARGQPLGLSETNAQSTLAAFDLDVEQSVWSIAPLDWEEVVSLAEKLVLDHTPRHGARAMDILHLAAATRLEVAELLSFDENQRRVAQASGLLVAP